MITFVEFQDDASKISKTMSNIQGLLPLNMVSHITDFALHGLVNGFNSPHSAM